MLYSTACYIADPYPNAVIDCPIGRQPQGCLGSNPSIVCTILFSCSAHNHLREGLDWEDHNYQGEPAAGASGGPWRQAVPDSENPVKAWRLY